MQYEEFPVSDHLKHWICGFFHWSGPAPERVLPNGQIDLLFSINDQPLDPDGVRVERHVRTVLYGKLRQPLAGPGSWDVDVFGVALFPWAAETVAGLGPRDLNGRILPLQKVGRVASEPIRTMLTSCVSNLERVRLMEEILSRTFPPAGEMETSLYRHWIDVWNHGGRSSIIRNSEGDHLAKARFDKMFHRQVGMTVRQFARLARFHAFLRRLEGGEKISILAQDMGYYDQAHLTRECRDLAGLPPRQLHVQLARGARVFRRDSSLAHTV